MIFNDKNKLKQILKPAHIFAAFCMSLFFISCSNLFVKNLNHINEASDDDKTYISLSIGTNNAARTIKPAELSTSDLTNYTLKGILNGSSEEKILAGPADFNSFPRKIMIESGSWTFTLTANYGALLYSDTTEVEIRDSTNNSINFVLKTDETHGGYEITFALKDTDIKYVRAVLKGMDKENFMEPVIETISQEQFTSNETVVLKRDLTDEDNRLQAGLYLLTVDFFADENDSTPINNWENYIAISEGFTTTASFDLKFNDIYTIHYDDLDSETPAAEIVSGLLIHKYSARSSFTLPFVKRIADNYVCGGWYDNGSLITRINTGTTGNKSLSPQYLNTIYVSGTGDDTTGDGTFANPFESIDKACIKIAEIGNPDIDWAICIMGDVTGPHTGTNKAGYRRNTDDYGRSSISNEYEIKNDTGSTITVEGITSNNAKSILLIGYNGLDENGIPKDKLNRGYGENLGSSGSSTGTVLAVSTEVPVTIRNLLITNGNCTTQTNSTNLCGGGINIAEGSTVSLADGAVVYKNVGYTGGGIYNAGTLYMYGTSIIGITSQEQDAVNNPANGCSENGGGIYNVGNVYLGYKSYESETVNTPEKWIGCINYNYSWRGGGINNRNTGTVIMRDGTIGHNQTVHGGSNGGGAGVYNYGTFEMSGGSIEYNYEGGNLGGGGVCNLSSTSDGIGVFRFTGGKIVSNNASYAGNSNYDSRGGGVYNNGKMYVYGDAVIGNEYALRLADNEHRSNFAYGEGGGIYVADSGELYMGYSSYTSETENTPETWNKGIYYNYSQKQGGALGTAGTAKVVYNSGTIANNGALKNGNGIYLYTNNFILCGNPNLSSSNENTIQDIVYYSSKTLQIADALSSIPNNSFHLIPSHDDSKTQYYTTQPVIALTESAQNSGLTLTDVKDKFIIEPLTATANGITTNWTIDETTGKVKKLTGSLYVDSANGSDNNNGLSQTTALATLSAALEKMDSDTAEYTVTINGNFSGPQVIDSTVTAGSIIIKGKSTSSTSLSCTFDNTSGTGSTLTINTSVPVTLDGIKITGGHGTNGGGLFIGEGANVVLQNYTSINANIASNAGAGVYISKNASLIMNTNANVSYNTGADLGGGIYVADGGYLKTLEGSGCDICNNQANLCGGGVYLENGSIFEQQGAYVRNNSVNEGGLGTGIYVSPDASYRISGSAEVTPPNDVYLKNNVKVVVANRVNSSPNARLTPETYPVEDEELVLLELSPNASSTLYWSSVNGNFEITPQLIDGDEYQYWFIDTNNGGKVTKRAGLGLTVTVVTGLEPDIEVTVTNNGVTVENNTKLSGGNLTFTASSGYSTYSWIVDEEEQNNESNTITLDTSTWAIGIYTVYLEAKDSNGKYYSYTAQINISNN